MFQWMLLTPHSSTMWCALVKLPNKWSKKWSFLGRLQMSSQQEFTYISLGELSFPALPVISVPKGQDVAWERCLAKKCAHLSYNLSNICWRLLEYVGVMFHAWWVASAAKMCIWVTGWPAPDTWCWGQSVQICGSQRGDLGHSEDR